MKLIRTILGIDKPAEKLGALLHEFAIVIAFCGFTAALTWPYINYLRDAVADPGDPYLVAWILWWDYHQTFTDPLNLFHANLFYPLRYTLAFSEHSYGIALLFFPLFAWTSSVDGPRRGNLSRLRFERIRRLQAGAHFTRSEAVAWVAGSYSPSFRFVSISRICPTFSRPGSLAA